MSQSSQSSQDLIKLLLGGGGVLGLITVVGGFAGFLIKQHVETLRQANQNLSKQNQDLQKKLEQAEAKEKKAVEEVSSITTIFETMQESSLSPADAARLKRVLGRCRRIQSMHEGFEVYKSAARWLDYRKSDWVDEAVNAAVQQHSKLVPKRLRKQFKQDISSYLDWVHISLYVYGHARAPVKKFVKQPSIQHSYPYRTAIEHIRDNGERQELTIEQANCLEKMLDELIKKIQNGLNK